MLECVFSDFMKSGEKGKEQDNFKLVLISKIFMQNSEFDIKFWCLSLVEKFDKLIFERLVKVDGMKKKKFNR